MHTNALHKRTSNAAFWTMSRDKRQSTRQTQLIAGVQSVRQCEEEISKFIAIKTHDTSQMLLWTVLLNVGLGHHLLSLVMVTLMWRAAQIIKEELQPLFCSMKVTQHQRLRDDGVSRAFVVKMLQSRYYLRCQCEQEHCLSHETQIMDNSPAEICTLVPWL